MANQCYYISYYKVHFIGPETDHVRSTVLVIIHHLKFSYKIPIDLKVIFFTIDRKVTVKKKKKKKKITCTKPMRVRFVSVRRRSIVTAL